MGEKQENLNVTEVVVFNPTLINTQTEALKCSIDILLYFPYRPIYHRQYCCLTTKKHFVLFCFRLIVLLSAVKLLGRDTHHSFFNIIDFTCSFS